MHTDSCPEATYAFCSHERKLHRQGGLPVVVQQVTRLSKLPWGNEKLMWRVTDVRLQTEAKLTPVLLTYPGFMGTGPKFVDHKEQTKRNRDHCLNNTLGKSLNLPKTLQYIKDISDLSKLPNPIKEWK